MQILGNSQFKSFDENTLVSIPLNPFIVLSGPNGAGKSNLIEGLNNGSVKIADTAEIPPDHIRLITLGQLTAAIEGPTQGAQHKEPWANIYNSLAGWKQQTPGASVADRNQFVRQNILNNQWMTNNAIDLFERQIGKPIADATYADFAKFGPLTVGILDPFAASIASLFLSYNARWVAQQVAEWRFEKHQEGERPETEDEFFARFGPKPWQLLDDALSAVGLSYTFVPPPDTIEQANYEVGLVKEDGTEIRVADLSSGERVLLAIAMGLFTGTQLTGSLALPRLLLLDEADASLHPSMVKSLLTVLQEIFVSQHGVSVILATHSPSTVALAPEESIYQMSPVAPRISQVSRDQALKALTVGISALSVKLENRRQVFVESDYDQSIYQTLHNILKDRITSERSAEFIAAGKRDIGGGCDAVIRLVRELTGAGNDSVRGLVDRDQRGSSPTNVFYVQDRYAVENLCLDPLLVGCFALREGYLTAEDLGLASGTRNFELRSGDVQIIIDAVVARLELSNDRTQVQYCGGFTAEVPRSVLETPGHDYEELVLQKFPQFNRHGSSLKRDVISKAGSDCPDFIPQGALTVLEAILSD